MQEFTCKFLHKLLFLIAISSWSLITACDTRAPLLNSERIQQKFGNYGVAVLHSEDGLRISNLYSEDAGLRTCRTYAVVEFMAQIDPEIEALHARIEAGESIGTTLQAAGWAINKRLKYIGEVVVDEPGAGLVKLMRIDVPRAVALHQYEFEISRGARTINYASIMEIHHPDYLTASDLRAIYGDTPPDTREL